MRLEIEIKFDPSIPLEPKASVRRVVFLWEITGDALAVVHRSMENGLRSKRKEEKLCSDEKQSQSTIVAS